LHRLLSIDPKLRAPLTWELFDPTRRLIGDSAEDKKKRIQFCQRNLDFMLSLAPHLNLIHSIGATLPEECLMAMVRKRIEVHPQTAWWAPSTYERRFLSFFVPSYTQGMDLPLLFDTFHLFIEDPAIPYQWDCTRPYYNYAKILQLLQMQASTMQDDERRWVLKCPIHLGMLPFLQQVFPDAKVVWIHRNITETIPSLARLIRVGMVNETCSVNVK
jgi:hypothetical protein